METKELKIVPPEGYEIDKKNSTLERIVFKKKSDDRPRSWEEFCKRGFTGEEACVLNFGAIQTVNTKGDNRPTHAVGYVDTIQEAEAFVALMQLRQLRKSWVGDWQPDWNKSDYKYAIEFHKGHIDIFSYRYTSKCLSFPTEDMAYEFMECFKDLLEQAKMLL